MPNIIINYCGKATFGKPLKIFPATHVNEMTRLKALKECVLQIHTFAPLQFHNYGINSHNGDTHTITRNVTLAAWILLKAMIHSKMTIGHCKYHYTLIKENNITIAHEDDDIAKQYHIENGARYFVFTTPITMCISGDGGALKKKPKYVKGLTVVMMLRIIALSLSLAHCKNTGIPILLSSLGEKNPRLKQYIRNVLNTIS